MQESGTKVRFGPSTLVAELNALAGRVREGAGTEVLEVLGAPMEQRFQLTDAQRGEVAGLEEDAAAVDRLKGLVARAGQDGTMRFVVLHSTGPDGALGHELVVQRAVRGTFTAPLAEFDAPEFGAPVEQGAIAHCDADCRNWGWG